MKSEPKVVVSKEKELMQNLREHCKNVELLKREKVKEILENWLNKKFGYGKKPWRAVEGRKKKLRPIPFKEYDCNIKWTGITEDFMTEVIQSLGFVTYPSLNGNGITLAIPQHKKGEKLTWAQEKIKRLNHDYSLYVSDEKRFAQFLFKEMLVELANYDIEKTEVCDKYILFRDYKFGETMGQKPIVFWGRPKWHKFLERLLRENGIEEYNIFDKYIGICVLKIKE